MSYQFYGNYRLYSSGRGAAENWYETSYRNNSQSELDKYRKSLENKADDPDARGDNYLQYNPSTKQLEYDMPDRLDENAQNENLSDQTPQKKVYVKYNVSTMDIDRGWRTEYKPAGEGVDGFFVVDDGDIDNYLKGQLAPGQYGMNVAGAHGGTRMVTTQDTTQYKPRNQRDSFTVPRTTKTFYVDVTDVVTYNSRGLGQKRGGDGRRVYSDDAIYRGQVIGQRIYRAMEKGINESFTDDNDDDQVGVSPYKWGGGNENNPFPSINPSLNKYTNPFFSYSSGRSNQHKGHPNWIKTLEGIGVQTRNDNFQIKVDNEFAGQKNEIAKGLNDFNREYNRILDSKETAYKDVIKTAEQTKGADYKQQRDKLRDLKARMTAYEGIDESVAAKITADVENEFKSFYRDNKLQKFDFGYDQELGYANTKGKPPVGVFDPDYYKTQRLQPQGLTEEETWNQALADDDIDITERFGTPAQTRLTDLEALNYLASNEDLIREFGTDLEKAKDHYKQYGIAEGRVLNFDAKQYLAEHKDLRDAFGIDEAKAMEHYIEYGYREGRKVPRTSTSYSPSLAGINDAEQGYYQYRYGQVKEPGGDIRGNAAKRADEAEDYEEPAPTDKELADIRDKMLDIDEDDPKKVIGSVEYIKDQWEQAQQAKEDGVSNRWIDAAGTYFNIDNADEFLLLFQQSQVEEDKQAFQQLKDNGLYITEIEDAITGVIGEEAILQTKKFGALTQNVLKDTIKEVKKAKAKEQELAIMGEFGTFGEIMDVNSSLADSLLGDTGIGGYLPFLGKDSGFDKQSLEDQLSGVTGIRNNVAYNWQKWFDETLTEKYTQFEGDYLELGFTAEEAENAAEQIVTIQRSFAERYVEDYLKPRFDESKSMNEFVDYLDVRQKEQNPFQTQSMLNAVQMVGEGRAKEYLDKIRDTRQDRYFSSDFYFNPTGAGESAYLQRHYDKQKETVAADWEIAKNTPNELVDPDNPSLGTWAERIYEYGTDVTNKNQFAKLHYQAKGQFNKDENGNTKPFDPAEDVINFGQVKEHIYKNIVPKLQDEATRLSDVFGEFVLPEEFADDMLEGLDPNIPESWEKVLVNDKGESLIEGFKGDFAELKDYIADAFRTGSAMDIREQIKYLNERREKPTQKILGIQYIQREEDYKTDSKFKGDTALYKAFQDAGYDGSEEEFYTEVFPDVDAEEQQFLSDITTKGMNETFGFTKDALSDPYGALDAISSFDSDLSNLFTEKEEDEDEDEDKDEDGTFSFGLSNLDYDKKKGNEFLKGYVPSFKKDNPIFKGFF